MAIIDATYLQRLVSTEEYARIFDRNATGTIDATAVASCIAIAESQGLVLLNGGRAVTLPLTGTIDEAVKVSFARMALYEAVRFTASDGAGAVKSPYRQAYEDAIAFLKAVKTDEVRPVTMNDGERPFPRANAVGLLNTDGNIGGVFVRAAGGSDRTGF